jgi:FMN phosphatase YigB (HAD superfamily)
VTRQTILFFDIDLTLVDNKFSGALIHDILEEMANACGESIDTLSKALGAENTRRQLEDPDNVLTMDWADMVQQMAQKHTVTLSGSFDKLWLEYAQTQGVDVLDNAPQVLQRLKTTYRTLVIATKGLSKYQDSVLETAGLTHYFDDILTPDKTGYLKTSPAYFDKYRNHDALFIQIGEHYYDDEM